MKSMNRVFLVSCIILSCCSFLGSVTATEKQYLNSNEIWKQCVDNHLKTIDKSFREQYDKYKEKVDSQLGKMLSSLDYLNSNKSDNELKRFYNFALSSTLKRTIYIVALTDKFQEKKTQNINLQQELETQKGSLTKAAQRQQDLTEKLESEKSNLTKVTEELKNKTKEVKDLEEALNKEKANSSQLEQQQRDLTEKLANEKSNLTKVTEELKNKTKEITDLRNASDEEKEELKKRVEQLTSENAELKQLFNVIQNNDEVDKMISNL